MTKQNHFSHHHLLRATPLFAVLALTCLVLYETSTNPFHFFPQSISSLSLQHAKNSTIPESKHTGKGELSLNQVLERAAMPDKTVIITTLNEAWIEPDSIFDLFLKNFRIGNQTLGLLKHLVVVALDKKAFDHCLGTLHLNCYYLTTQGVDFSCETNFNTWNYFSMMWRRIDFLQSILEMGYNFVFTASEENNLEKVLRKAVMKDNKTVIITTLNGTWSQPNSIFDLFLESFKIGNETQNLLKHVVVGAFDMKAYSRCIKKHLNCYAIRTEGVDFSGNANLSSEDYLKMTWQKMDVLVTVLEMGYDCVFTDADVMWLRDPFPRFYPGGDIQITCDNSTHCNNSANTGFKYVKSNNRTIQLYKYWRAGKYYFPNKHDQIVFNNTKISPFIREIGLEMRFLETSYFGGFCEPSRDLDLLITMHENCCLGLDNKIQDLKLLFDDWKNYMSLPNGIGRDLSTMFWNVPLYCRNWK